MNKLASRSRRLYSARKPKRERAATQEAKDRLLVDLELQQTRLQIQVDQLQRLQNEFEKSQRHLDAIYQSIPIGYITLNEKGLITEWNASAAALLDANDHGLLHAPLPFFAAHDDVERVLDHLRRCRRSERGQVITELRLKQKGRVPVPVQVISRSFHHEKRLYFQTALIDLTERQRSERAAADARELSDAIIETIHEPLVVLDSGLKIIRINQAFSKLFHIPRQLAQRRALESVLNLWWAGNGLRARLEQTFSNGDPLSNFEFEGHPPRLGRRIFLVNARRLHQKAGSQPVLLVALEDITARKDAERQLAESNRQLHLLNDELEKRVDERTRELRESNKQLEGFCYTIAHDLRGPLRAMAGFGTALHDDFADKLGEIGSDYTERIVAAGQRMDDLIRDLLEYGRVNTLDLALDSIDADQVLDQVIENLQPVIGETGARIVRKEKLPSVVAHKMILETALFNLLSNALKFVPPGAAPEVKIWPEERADEILIWIADHGIGIEGHLQEKIFEVFQRLHPEEAYPGTGIGLAIVRRALQRIGGAVGVTSQAGKGSRFWISVPRVAEHAVRRQLNA